jgi:hypothetical protein
MTQTTSETATATEVRPTPSHDRLAELVMHLTDCPAPLAVAAVNEAAGEDDLESQDERLMVVARAMVSVKHGIDLRA